MQRCWIDYDGRTVFFWAPKCANTTLASFLANRFEDDRNDLPGHPRQWMKKRGYGAEFAVGYQLCNRSAYRSIAVTRHPFTRVLSAYLNKFVVYKGERIASIDDLETFALDAYQEVAERTGKSTTTYEGLSFFEFIDYLHAVGVVDGKPGSLNPHWRPQVPVAGFDLKGFYDHVIQVDREPLEVGLSRVLGETVTPEDVGVINQTSYKASESVETSEDADLSEVNSLDLPTEFQPQNFYSEEVATKIAELYRQDFHRMGYDEDPWASPKPPESESADAQNSDDPAPIDLSGGAPIALDLSDEGGGSADLSDESPAAADQNN